MIYLRWIDVCWGKYQTEGCSYFYWYVNDILAVLGKEEVDALMTLLIGMFSTMQFKVLAMMTYVDMRVSILDEYAIVDMMHYVKQLLEDIKIGVKLSLWRKILKH